MDGQYEERYESEEYDIRAAAEVTLDRKKCGRVVQPHRQQTRRKRDKKKVI